MEFSFSLKKISYSLLVAVVSAATVAMFQNCSRTQLGNPDSDTPQNEIAAIPFEGTPLIEVLSATQTQCSGGGKIYTVYHDFNKNFIFDEEDIVVSTQVVCNGTNGNDGASSLISMNRVFVENEVCIAQRGIQLSSGLDINKNKILDSVEISHTEVLCDGANGLPGAAGPAGANGHGVVFSIVSAPSTVCENGGSIIMMALDIENKGVYNIELPNQQSATICNGTNGTNGMNAEPSPYEIVSMIKACGDTVTNKEVILRLKNGQLLASVSDNVNGYNTRLAIVADGNYMNTDPSKCSFSISTQNYIRSISWKGAVQESWEMPH